MKKRYLKPLLFTVLFSTYCLYSRADTCTSISDGGWNQPEVWSCGHAPGCGDTIYIDHYIEITATTDYTGCAQPMFIIVNSGGTLNFDSGRKLKLPCGSGVTILPGGAMTSDGGGASESLQICDVTEWQGSDGDVTTGPTIFGSGLPIELVDFSVYRNGDVVNIEWITASETNNDYFTVERGSNGLEFEPILVTDGAGNSSSYIDYFEIDYNPLEGANYYRLKQTDFDGNFSYSDIVVVKTYGQLASELLLYPNPTDQSFHIQLNGFGDEEILVVVRDITSKEQFSKVIVTSTDHHIEAIDISNKLAAGTYMVTASSRNELYTQKLIVK